jgi:hypothetical protein
VNARVEVTEPDGVVITISFAPTVVVGVVIVKAVCEFDPSVALTPPTVTDVALSKFVPVITVVVPPAVTPDVMLRDVIVGGGLYE